MKKIMAKVNRNWLRDLPGTGFLLFFGLFWSGITLTFDFFIAKGTSQQLQALAYPTVMGTVTHSEVKVSRGGRSSSCSPDIRYTYSVDGKPFQGERYRYGGLSTNDRSAYNVVALYPVGKQVEVHYSLSDPADAVLRAGLEGIDLFVPIFLLPFNLIMLGMWAALVGGIRQRLFRSVAGGANLLEDGGCLRVRLAAWSPFCVGLGASGATAFLLSFAIGFPFGFNPPLWAALTGWGLISVAGGIVHLVARGKQASGDYDLVIDEFAQSITLPRTFRRRGDVVVPWKEIVCFEVDEVAKRGSKGGTSYQYVPTVTFHDGNGLQHREKLIEWQNAAAAEALVDWLRERLGMHPATEESGDV